MKQVCLTVMLWAALLTGVARAQEAGNPLVGTWSYSSQRSDGSAAFVYFFRFGGDGTFQQQLSTNMGAQTYVGRYGLSADAGTLQLVYLDYSPKQDCRFGFCYPMPAPSFAMGSPMNLAIRFSGGAAFETMDASGPMMWVRNQ